MTTVRRVFILMVFAAGLGVAGLGDAPAQTKGKTPPPREKPADPPAAAGTLTFEIYKDAGGKFRWRLKGPDDVNLGMASKGYESKADCQKTIDAIKAGAAKAKVDDQAK